MLNSSRNMGKTSSLMADYSARVSEAMLRNRTRDAEQRARLEIEFTNRIKSEFISNMSHELRTPLNTVIGFSKILAGHERREIDPREVSEYAQLIHAAADKLLSVINDILDISKIQSGRYTIEKAEIAIDEILESIVSAHRQAAKDADIVLELACGADVPNALGDPGKLSQALANLVSNAVKFTQAGGTVRIEARGIENGSGTLVRISDTGIGMNAEDISIALAPFGQVDGTRARLHDGAGLGLPIAKALIELHGGTLSLRSTKWIGTEAIVHLPSAQAIATMEKQNLTLGLVKK